jgi:hypothetical protein
MRASVPNFKLALSPVHYGGPHAFAVAFGGTGAGRTMNELLHLDAYRPATSCY